MPARDVEPDGLDLAAGEDGGFPAGSEFGGHGDGGEGDSLVEMVRRRKPTHLVPKAKRHVLGVRIQRRARRGREVFGDGGKDGGIGDVGVWNGVREEDGEPPGEGGGGDEETGGEFEGGSEEGVVVGEKGGEVRGAEHRVDGVEKGAWGRVVGGGG
ncbi:MAG: hypothetical protein Q9185_006456 [Variospora sp. 1 TL-2023]